MNILLLKVNLHHTQYFYKHTYSLIINPFLFTCSTVYKNTYMKHW
jgi:hypothetical protein